ncbi:MAG: hypothetical protein SFY81_09030 [Verrucomicrobiota bacterium]|nr:hypothetical protein [Verrucomicrobiota bacterium]
MKSKKHSEHAEFREVSSPYGKVPESEMVRTQIYLTRAEHDFLLSESNRRNQPMAAIIRELVDEKMSIPEEAWLNNPLLQAPVEDADFPSREDGSLNHDHYIAGGPRKYEKAGSKWVLQPPMA